MYRVFHHIDLRIWMSTTKQKGKQMTIADDLISLAKQGPGFLTISLQVTKCFVIFFDIQTKDASSSWKSIESLRSKKFRQYRRGRKVMTEVFLFSRNCVFKIYSRRLNIYKGSIIYSFYVIWRNLLVLNVLIFVVAGTIDTFCIKMHEHIDLNW